MSHDEYIENVRSFIKVPSGKTNEQLDRFCCQCTYVSGHGSGDTPYEDLGDHLNELARRKTSQIRIFYMALPPKVFVPVSGQLKKFCYSEDAESRILVSPASRIIFGLMSLKAES